MTTLTDLPLPGDWPRRRLLLLSVLAHVLMLGMAVRHLFITGKPHEDLLNLAEGACLIVFVLLAGTAFARVLRQASSLELGFLWRGGALLTVLAMLAPPFLSSDLWDYVARGYVAVLGHNPYVVTVDQLKDVPSMTPFVGGGASPIQPHWTGWVMPYGPISAILQWLCATLGAPWPAAYAWKALCALAHLGTAWFVLQTLRVVGTERDARRGLVLWLWNPWILLECCGSGHNEALVATGLAGVCFAVARNRFFAAALGYGATALTKHGIAPLSIFLLITAFWRRQRLPFLAGTAVTILALVVTWWFVWQGPNGFDWFFKQGDVQQGSLVSLSSVYVGQWLSRGVRLLAWAAVGLLMLLAVNRGKDAVSFARLGTLAMVVFLTGCMHNFTPWYHLWWLPLFALAQLPVLERALGLLAWTGPLYYLLFLSTHEFTVAHEVWGLAIADVWPALLILLEWRALTGIKRKSTAADLDHVPTPHAH